VHEHAPTLGIPAGQGNQKVWILPLGFWSDEFQSGFFIGTRGALGTRSTGDPFGLQLLPKFLPRRKSIALKKSTLMLLKKVNHLNYYL
jgi:hypothetical protein